MDDWILAAALGISVLLTVASVLTLNVALIGVGILSAFAIAFLYRLWFVIEAVLFRHTHLVELLGCYELDGARETAVRKIRGMFCATAAASLVNGAKRPVDRESLEEIVRQVHAPFKFVLQVERLNARKILDTLQTRASMKRIELSRLGSSSAKKGSPKLDALKREISELESEISAISASAPMRLRHYLMTSALSDSRFVASERAVSQITELSSRFGALLGSEPELLSGTSLAEVLELDSTLVE